MGRRSINTTKSGKYMNPTDQASECSTVFASPTPSRDQTQSGSPRIQIEIPRVRTKEVEERSLQPPCQDPESRARLGEART